MTKINKIKIQERPWPSCLSIFLCTEGLPILFPVKAYNQVVGSIPSQDAHQRQQINVSLSHEFFSLFISLPASLKPIKTCFKKFQRIHYNNATEIRRIIKYCYASKLVKLEEIDKFLENTPLSRLNQRNWIYKQTNHEQGD